MSHKVLTLSESLASTQFRSFVLNVFVAFILIVFCVSLSKTLHFFYIFDEVPLRT